ncbi:MAG: hypothetical protein OK449_02160 [Thaumarchaeota archaeon]|nr:hypothetical protein [Nitrososphaerota archaeon]
MLNVPRKNPKPNVDIISSRVPTPDEMVVVSRPILSAVGKILPMLKNNVNAVWAVGGDAGEQMMGVNVKADYLEILTTKEGCDEIRQVLAEYQTLAPAMVQKKLPRGADVDGMIYPIYNKSYYAEFAIDGVKLEVHGDLQFKVGEWDWGDPLEFKADYTYIVGGKLPLVPLSLKSELDLGLGWLDRVSLITDAVLQKHHDH